MSLEEKIIEQYQNGNIAYMTQFGIEVAKLDEFIQQPVDGILYDLNRNEATTLTLIKNVDIKWVNDYAVAKVIRALKAKIDELESK